jgi:DNA-binding transcriptional regulator/RsmH inhibitor MraZ
VFRGSCEYTLDEKGRVKIPRNSLGMQDDRLIVTKFLLDMFRCLDAYPHAEWERFEQELNTKPRFDPNFLKLETP